jgi:hypothetical protein
VRKEDGNKNKNEIRKRRNAAFREQMSLAVSHTLNKVRFGSSNRALSPFQHLQSRHVQTRCAEWEQQRCNAQSSCFCSRKHKQNYILGRHYTRRTESLLFHVLLKILSKAVRLPPCRRQGGRGIDSSYSLLTSALDGGQCSVSHLGRALPPAKGPPVPTE